MSRGSALHGFNAASPDAVTGRYWGYGSVSADMSTVEVNTASGPVNGLYDVVVELLDSAGHPVPLTEVTLVISPAGLSSDSPLTTDADGLCEFTIDVDTFQDETYTFVASAAGVELTQQPTLQIIWNRNVTLPGGANVDAYTEAGDPTDAYRWNFTVNADITSLDMGGAWHADSEFTLNNLATIYGVGGAGGNSGLVGAAGGNAIDLGGITIAINNAGGYIFGGGGGGGGGGAVAGQTLRAPIQGADTTIAGGAGGGGAGGNISTAGALSATYVYLDADTSTLTNSIGTVSAGTGAPEFVECNCTVLPTVGVAGGPGGFGAGGVGGEGDALSDFGEATSLESGAGGAGGDFGAAGSAGAASSGEVTGNGSTTAPVAGAAGGAAGKAINLDGGAVNWAAGNTVDRVKGAVS